MKDYFDKAYFLGFISGAVFVIVILTALILINL